MRPSMIASPPVQPISLEQLRHRLGEDDGAAEVRLAAAERPARAPHVQGEHDLACPDDAGRGLEPSGPDGGNGRVLEQLDAAVDRCALQRKREAGRLHGRTVTEVGGPAEARRVTATPRLGRIEQLRLLLDAELVRGLDGVLDPGVLGFPGRHTQQPALAEPDVFAAALAECAHLRHDPGRGVRQLQSRAVTQNAAQRRQRRPVAVEEAPVASARPVADLARFEERDAQRRLPFA